MADLLNEVVVPFMRSNRIMHLRSDRGVEFTARHESNSFVGSVFSAEGVMIIVINDIALFPSGDSYVYEISNAMNFRGPGKFVAAHASPSIGTRINFILEMFVSGEFGQREFRHVLESALSSAANFREPLMRVRYGGMTWEQAVKPSARRVDRSKRSSKVKKEIDEAIARAEKYGAF